MKIQYRYHGFDTYLYGTISIVAIIWTILEKEYFVAAIFFLILGISFLIYCFGGSLSIDEKNVIRKNLFGKNIIKWSDMVEIEYDKSGWGLNLKAEGRNLPIPGPRFWLSKNYTEFSEAFQKQIDDRAIPQKQKPFVFLKSAKNAK